MPPEKKVVAEEVVLSELSDDELMAHLAEAQAEMPTHARNAKVVEIKKMAIERGILEREPSLVEVALQETHANVGTTLYDMSEEYEMLLLEAEAVAAAGEGEIPEELFDAIDMLEEDIDVKIENYIRLYKNMKLKQAQKEAVGIALLASVQPILDESSRYKAQGKAIDAEITRLRDRLANRLEDLARTSPEKYRKKLTKKEKEAGKQRGNPYFKCDAGSAWVQDNPPGVVLLVEPTDMPMRFMHPPTEDSINKTALKAALENEKDSGHEAAIEVASIDQTRGGRVR